MSVISTWDIGSFPNEQPRLMLHVSLELTTHTEAARSAETEGYTSH